MGIIMRKRKCYTGKVKYNGLSWQYLGDAKGSSVALPSRWNEILITVLKTSGYTAIGSALVLNETVVSNEFRYIYLTTKLAQGNVGISKTYVAENETVFDAILVYAR